MPPASRSIISEIPNSKLRSLLTVLLALIAGPSLPAAEPKRSAWQGCERLDFQARNPLPVPK